MQRMDMVRKRLNPGLNYDRLLTAIVYTVAFVWGAIFLATLPKNFNNTTLTLLAIRAGTLLLFVVLILLASLLLDRGYRNTKITILVAILFAIAVSCPIVTVFTYI